MQLQYQRMILDEEQTLPEDHTSAALPSHPLAIRPAGNAYTSKINLRSAAGFFRRLKDELINEILEYLDAQSLQRIGSTCKALYAFSRSEELWKALFLKYSSPYFPYLSSSIKECTYIRASTVKNTIQPIFLFSSLILEFPY